MAKKCFLKNKTINLKESEYSGIKSPQIDK